MKKFLYRARLALIALLLCGALVLLRLAKNAGAADALCDS